MSRNEPEKDVERRDSSSRQVDPEEQHHLKGTKLYIILMGIGLAVFLMALDVSVLATAIPSITARFHSTPDIGWYGAAYPLTICSLQPVSGKLYSLFSLKKTFIAFIAIFLFGSLLCGIAVSSSMFIGGRAVAGAGAAGILSGGLAIMAVVIPLSKRALYNGLLGSFFGLATIVGPLFGGALTSKASWRWCFYINLPFGAITVVVLVLFFKPPKRGSDARLTVREKILKLDLVGCALFMPSIVMILLALQWGGNQYAWKSATVIGLICGSSGLIAVFFAWEHYKGNEAMVPLSVLLDRSVILSCLYGFCIFSSYILGVYYLPEWFQVVKQASPLHSGVLMLPAVVAQIVAATVSGLIVNRTGYYNPWFFIGAALLCISMGLYTTITPSTPHAHWIFYQILQGLGVGISLQIALLSVQAVLASKPHQIPIGISLIAFFQYFGMSVAQSIGLAVFQNQLIHALKDDAGLDEAQVNRLLLAGSARAAQTAREAFPGRLTAVVMAYNKAITSVYYAPVAMTIVGFLVATGIKWKNLKKKDGNSKIPKGDEAGAAPSPEEDVVATVIPIKGLGQLPTK